MADVAPGATPKAYVADVVFSSCLSVFRADFGRAAEASAQPFGGLCVVHPVRELGPTMAGGSIDEFHAIFVFPSLAQVQAWQHSASFAALLPATMAGKARVDLALVPGMAGAPPGDQVYVCAHVTFTDEHAAPELAGGLAGPPRHLRHHADHGVVAMMPPSDAPAGSLASRRDEPVKDETRMLTMPTEMRGGGALMPPPTMQLIEFETLAQAMAWKSSAAYRAVVPATYASTTSGLVYAPGMVPAGHHLGGANA